MTMDAANEAVAGIKVPVANGPTRHASFVWQRMPENGRLGLSTKKAMRLGFVVASLGLVEHLLDLVNGKRINDFIAVFADATLQEQIVGAHIQTLLR